MSSIFDRKIGLTELVEYKKKLEQEMEISGETMPDEVVELSDVANQLLAGKVDAAARFKQGLEAHIKACQDQIKYLGQMLETTERLMKEAVEISGSNRLDGKTYSIRVQNNSRASTIIDDPSKIPSQYFKVSFTQDFKYDEHKILYWSRCVLGKKVTLKTDLNEVELKATDHASKFFYRLDVTKEERDLLEKTFKMDPSKSEIEASLKKDPQSLQGARLDRGTHLRVEPGKAKTKEIA